MANSHRPVKVITVKSSHFLSTEDFASFSFYYTTRIQRQYKYNFWILQHRGYTGYIDRWISCLVLNLYPQAISDWFDLPTCTFGLSTSSFLAPRRSVFLWSRENGRHIIVFAVMYEHVNLPCMCFMIGIHIRILQEAFFHKRISIYKLLWNGLVYIVCFCYLIRVMPFHMGTQEW